MMRQRTIAEKREAELSKLVEFKTKTPTSDDYDEARRNMNSYYRLCGLSERNLEYQNNAMACNAWWVKESEDRELRWHKRLDEIFNKTYGLSLVYCGYMPSIGIEKENGGFADKISTFFYDR